MKIRRTGDLVCERPILRQNDIHIPWTTRVVSLEAQTLGNGVVVILEGDIVHE